jgi:hypothetical protein
MAKIKTNKTSPVAESKSSASKARYSAEEIKNGWIVEKSWTDEKGMYHCEKVYHENNPFEGNPMKG